MKKIFIFLLFTFLSLALYAEDDCLTKGNTPEQTLKETNLLELVVLSESIKEQSGGPNKGFYLFIQNQTDEVLKVAFAIEAAGDPKNFFFYREGTVQGFWKIKPGGFKKIFIERILPREYYIHAHGTASQWGKEKNFVVEGGDVDASYAFNKKDPTSSCKAEEDGVVVCRHTYKK